MTDENESITTPEVKSSEKIIFTGAETKVILPEKPLVDKREGTHLRISPSIEQPPYFRPEAKISQSLKPFLTSLGAARSVFGDPSNKDEYYLWSQWVNVHLVPRFGGQEKLQIEVVGRNARGDTWAQPVGYPENENYQSYEYVDQEVQMLEREIPKNVASVLEESNSVVLFNKPGIESNYEPDEKSVMQVQNYEIRAPRENPHVEEGGLHLWIYAHRDESAEGVQSDIANGVEQFILASAVSKIIYEKFNIPIEIHFSGNWGLPTKGHWQERLSAHANLYGAPPGSEGVKLPPRPDYQRPAIDEETRSQVINAIREKMPDYIQEFIGQNLAKFLEGNNE